MLKLTLRPVPFDKLNHQFNSSIVSSLKSFTLMIILFEHFVYLIHMKLKISQSDSGLIILYQQLYLKHDGDV